MNTKNKFYCFLIVSVFLLGSFFTSCQKEKMSAYVREPEVELTDKIDIWFYDNFQKPYNSVVRWKWDDAFVDTKYYVTPPRRDVMIPVGEMIINFWMEPFVKQGGADFIREHFPPEIVCIGSPLLNPDGTQTLGYAEAGVRITLTDLNRFNIKNDFWLLEQLRVIHHEFTHIVHQKHGLPDGYELVTKENYIGNAWVNLGPDDAIRLGMISPYGSSDQFEDFSDLISIYLTTKKDEFNATYLNPDDPDKGLNAGKAQIAEKLSLAEKYYFSNFGIKLDELRDIILERISNR